MRSNITSILVPGAAGPAGINTIKSLKMAGFKGKIVATDSSKLSAGFFMASAYAIMPKVVDELNYMGKLEHVINNHNIEVLMPSSGYDIQPFSKHRKQIEKLGAIPVVSDFDSMEICYDKMMTFQKLNGRFDMPFTTTDPDKIPEFPVIAKPRREKGGYDMMIIESEVDLRQATSRFQDMIFQEYLPGEEYTIDMLSDLNKKPIIAVPRIRLETKGGISTKGKVIHDNQVEQVCMDVADFIGIRGPCCIQMKGAKDGRLKLVEVNPRMGGATIFATLAGVNFPALILDMVEEKEIVKPSFSEITIIRYFEEIIVDKKTAS
ncbi:MAG: ATP-grasp domain-containing protein [Thermoproteota archaeon]|nr:ATP-grasp domain-containing protein [Thermoproteota archaeon]